MHFYILFLDILRSTDSLEPLVVCRFSSYKVIQFHLLLLIGFVTINLLQMVGIQLIDLGSNISEKLSLHQLLHAKPSIWNDCYIFHVAFS